MTEAKKRTGPFAAHLEAADAKFAAEQEAEVPVTLKGKHISMLRQLTFERLQLNKSRDTGNPKAEYAEESELITEIDNILHQAGRLI